MCGGGYSGTRAPSSPSPLGRPNRLSGRGLSHLSVPRPHESVMAHRGPWSLLREHVSPLRSVQPPRQRAGYSCEGIQTLSRRWGGIPSSGERFPVRGRVCRRSHRAKLEATLWGKWLLRENPEDLGWPQPPRVTTQGVTPRSYSNWLLPAPSAPLAGPLLGVLPPRDRGPTSLGSFSAELTKNPFRGNSSESL